MPLRYHIPVAEQAAAAQLPSENILISTLVYFSSRC